MKILLLPSYYPSSYNEVSGVFFRDHALALQSCGHTVAVLAVVPISLKTVIKARRLDFSLRYFDDRGVRTYLRAFPSIPKCKGLNNFIRVTLCKRAFREIRHSFGLPEITHVHSFLAGDFARKLRATEGIPYVVTEHSSAFALGLLSAFEERLAFRVLTEANRLTAVSGAFARLLSERYGRSVAYTPNVVEASPHSAEDTRFPPPAPGCIRICSVGLMNANKRHDRLIRAFARILQEHPRAELHIGGDGPQMHALRALTSDLGCIDKITFHGALRHNEVFSLMRSSHAFALSSDYETFGVVLIEAMYQGLPVVSTRCGGPESIVTDRRLGILAEKDDESMTAALSKILGSIERGEVDREFISRYARTTFSFDAVGKQMTNLYGEVLNAH